VHQQPTALPLDNPYLDHAVGDYFRHHESTAKVAVGRSIARSAEDQLGSRGRMLEVGCGRGELLEGAVERGWQVAGVEMTAPFAEICLQRGIEVEVAPVESARALEREWDVIVLGAVLEHLYEPGMVLRRVAGALRQGGLLFLDVPNECSLYNYVGNAYLRLRGRDWVTNLSPTFPPFHVVGYCPRSLRTLLAAVCLAPVTLTQYRTVTCMGAFGFRASLEAAGMEAALSVGQLVGMGAGLRCWARKT
jgi:2-polyprenyl-3-methyl-5-hydroxy-6-metoxy-1,4-benzoquinol methylase